MDICIAADNNYASILQVVILSIIQNNKNHDLNFHIFESQITQENKDKMTVLVDKYKKNIFFYDIDKYIQSIKKDISNEWAEKNSYVAYARLYMPDMLDKNIDKFLYLDCDVLVNGDISDLFNFNMDNYVIAGVKDALPHFYKKHLGLDDGNYYNSGVLVFNSKLWREEKITPKIMNYCVTHQNDLFPDQDALNIVLKNRIKTLSPKYCTFYPEGDFSSRRQIKGYCGTQQQYYSYELLNEMKNNPIIIHYTDSILGRPWQINNINPHSKLWMYYYNSLPEECKMNFVTKRVTIKGKIYRLLYKILPVNVFSFIYYYKKNTDIKNRMENIK